MVCALLSRHPTCEAPVTLLWGHRHSKQATACQGKHLLHTIWPLPLGDMDHETLLSTFSNTTGNFAVKRAGHCPSLCHSSLCSLCQLRDSCRQPCPGTVPSWPACSGRMLEPELLCAYTELSSPVCCAGRCRRSSLPPLVRNRFCLLQSGSSVHLAVVS